MKKRKLHKTLQLNKETICNLTSSHLARAVGGLRVTEWDFTCEHVSELIPCDTNYCEPQG